MIDEHGKPVNFHRNLDEALASCIDSADALAEAVVNASKNCDHAEVVSTRHSQMLQDMLRRRSAARSPEERKALSKQVWKRLRHERQQERQDKLDALISAGKGAKELVRLMTAPVRRKRTAAMTDTHGNRKNEPDDMAEVFATCYEQLYNTLNPSGDFPSHSQASRTPVTAEEVG